MVKEGFLEGRKDLTNIYDVLNQSLAAIENNSSIKLKELSDKTVHSATIRQDPASIIVAVLVYSVGKILQRENYRNLEGWNDFYKQLLIDWKLMVNAAKTNNYDDTIKYAGEIRHSLDNISGHLGEYIKDIFRKAEINKAFKLYEHGLSSAQTAELLGVSLWDLASYIGQSKVHEMNIPDSMPEVDRIKMVENFLDEILNF